LQADKTKVLRLLKTARGQLDGLMKMVEEDRYCIDISHQLLATQAILRRANNDILKAHLAGCVSEAIHSGNGEEKIEEILKILEELTK
jgi:DNA-binding FrmR family transcriptional regulator